MHKIMYYAGVPYTRLLQYVRMHTSSQFLNQITSGQGLFHRKLRLPALERICLPFGTAASDKLLHRLRVVLEPLFRLGAIKINRYVFRYQHPQNRSQSTNDASHVCQSQESTHDPSTITIHPKVLPNPSEVHQQPKSCRVLFFAYRGSGLPCTNNPSIKHQKHVPPPGEQIFIPCCCTTWSPAQAAAAAGQAACPSEAPRGEVQNNPTAATNISREATQNHPN